MSDLPDNAPAPRLCHITKWADFEGYGFNLHAEKNKIGQYIGVVDKQSPAEASGLLKGDRIIEVNGVNIANENHKQVVVRIKAVLDETKLLVVDTEADKWYKSKNIVVNGDMPNIIYKSSKRSTSPTPSSTPSTPPPPPPPSETTTLAVENDNSKILTNGHHSDHSHHSDEGDNRSVSSDKSAASSSASSEASTQPQSPMSSSPTPPPSLTTSTASTPTAAPPAAAAAAATTTASPNKAPSSVTSSTKSRNNYNSSGLNLNMTAAEMRALLASKKKVDPRRGDPIDLKTKYRIIQDM